MMTYTNTRRFRLWRYYVSHGQLLIRSSKREDILDDLNIDLIFQGVFYLEVSCRELVSIEVRESNSEEVRYLETRCGIILDETHRYFTINSQNQLYFLGAASFAVENNKLAAMETTFPFTG